MRSPFSAFAALPIALSLVLATCSSGPTAGELLVSLSTSQADTRAIQFTAAGSADRMIEDVTPACSGCQVYTTRVSDTESRGVITGPIQSGPLLRLLVSDRDASDAYSVQIIEVANQQFILLGSGGFQLEVSPP